jgi:L-seryl-tRNA(Ser) seleniumtransferase
MNNSLANIPPVSQILDRLAPQLQRVDQIYLKRIIETELNELRHGAGRSGLKQMTREDILTLISGRVGQAVEDLLAATCKYIINCSGVILHTGLGRAPFSEEDLRQLTRQTGYVDLEIDLESGKRGDRLDHVVPLLKILTGAEDAVVVNNNAAAVLLTLNSLASGKEVIVSRGELVEIGGSFRLPEVMKISRAKMVEVGTTNKTHLHDYEQAITARTAAILLVHPSNYQVVGFTAKPAIKDMLNLAQAKHLPLIFDLGSGALIDMRALGLSYEPLAGEMLSAGIDVVTFSGDKLLGGPQAGIILGRKELLKKIRQNHLLRALRCNKTTLSLLADCLRKYLKQDSLRQDNLTLNLLSRQPEELRIIAQEILSSLKTELRDNIEIVEARGRVGSGAYPVLPLPALALKIISRKLTCEKVAAYFRKRTVPIIGYIENDFFYLNLLAVFKKDCPEIISALNNLP